MYQFIYSHGQYVSILTPTHARACPQYGQHLGLEPHALPFFTENNLALQFGQ